MVRQIEEGEIAEVLELSIDTIKAWEEAMIKNRVS